MGLSPHAWGNHKRRFEVLAHKGSIPTRVGEPPDASGGSDLTQVYPHTRGGTRGTARGSTIQVGLSPHAWGNLFDRVHD